MSTESDINPSKKLILARLPWIVAAAALLVYCVTLNRWITLESLPHVVQTVGWDGQIPHSAPLFYLVTTPFRLLPANWVPIALNLFAAVCAALTLAQLARSVALLPQDRTREQRLRERGEHGLLSLSNAWLPPVLAVVACGWQLTFWENATAASGEMFNLLVFSYLIRTLLEYRIDKNESRLWRFAFVHGLAITNNWAMIGFLPAFLTAIVWIKGLKFFNVRFLRNMVLWGLAGLTLYLLLPAVHAISDLSQVGFWQVLKANLVEQKKILFAFPRYLVLLLGLTSLLPVLLMGIRWSSSTGDTSAISINLATGMFHLVHALFLGACLWVAFDPPFSPRKLGFGIPFLTFYYLGALAVGYYSGYFMLVSRPETTRSRVHRTTKSRRAVTTAVTALLFLSLTGLAVGLLYRNGPKIKTANSNILREHALIMADGLPEKSSIVLSDDPTRLYLLEAVLHERGNPGKHTLLDTRALQVPSYHKFLLRKYPDTWEKTEITGAEDQLISTPQLIQLLAKLASNNEIYYLHHSFGYYFELFHSHSEGLLQRLAVYQDNSASAPRPSPEIFEKNKAFWSDLETRVLTPLKPRIKQQDRQAVVAGLYYSLALNTHGVEVQRLGKPEEATAYFENALEMNPENVVAQVNLDYNRKLLEGDKSAVTIKNVEDKFGKFRNWEQIIGGNGQFDEPNFCIEQGRIFLQGGLYRQAAQQFERTIELTPNNINAHVWLAQLYTMAQQAPKALALVRDIRNLPAAGQIEEATRIELLRIEAWALFAQQQNREAHQVLQRAIREYPDNQSVLSTAAQLYVAVNDYSNALVCVEKQLAANPDEPQALNNKAGISIQMQKYADALPPLNQLLSQSPTNHAARMNRAIANLQLSNLDDSRQDYQVLLEEYPDSFRVHFGLAEIAYKKKETNTALKHYERYLQTAPANSEEEAFVKGRVVELKGRSE